MSASNLLVFKKIALFVFLFGLFFWPGQNQYLIVLARQQPAKVRLVELDLSLTAYPVNTTGKPAPWLSAQAALVVDPDSSVVLYAKNHQEQFLPASIVKMMTALVALEHYQLDDYLLVNIANGLGQDMDLVPGEQISVRNLLYGVLVGSANDAAAVLADHYPGGQPGFVTRMNQKARQLHLSTTVFTNPTGLDSDEQDVPLVASSFSTALDLSRLARWSWRYPIFRQMVATSQVTVTDASGMKRHPLFNVNTLLGRLPGIKGIKTGWTERAGECLASLIERDSQRVMVIILGSQDRFGETTRLVEWAFANYQWQAVRPT